MSRAYSVSQINSYIKSIFEHDGMLSRISVKGEISNCKYHSTGHIYFTLKDESGQLACVMFASRSRGLSFTLREGMQVICSGQINVYERDGKYQLYVEKAEKDGEGALYEEFERLKLRLQSEGLFDDSHKKPVPAYAKTVGIVTASTGAALQDIRNISKRRNPYVKLILYPAKVQGTGAAQTIVKGIKYLDSHKLCDVIIVGRGGGSIEDLWAFNEEVVARAIYECVTPIISAVGHEVDFTIADFAADHRAPTPSAGAEIAVFDYNRFMVDVIGYHSMLLKAMNKRLDYSRSLLNGYSLKLKLNSPKSRLDAQKQELSVLETRLGNSMKDRITNAKHSLAISAERLEGLSPLKQLSRGYGYVTDMDGANIKSVSSVSEKDRIDIRLTDGVIEAEVLNTLKQN